MELYTTYRFPTEPQALCASSTDPDRFAVAGRNLVQMLKVEQYANGYKQVHLEKDLLQGTSLVRDVANLGSICDVRFGLHQSASKIATVSTSGKIFLFDIEAKLENRFVRFNAHKRAINTIAFSPHDNGNLLLSGSQDGTIKLWDLRSRGMEKRAIAEFSKPFDAIRCNEFSPHEPKIFCCVSESGDLTKWDTRYPLKPVTNVRKAHSHGALTLEWNPHFNYVATGGSDRKALVWDMSNDSGKKKPLYTVSSGNLVAKVSWVPQKPGNVPKNVSETGLACCYASGSSRIDVWNLQRPHVPMYSLSHHTRPVTGLHCHTESIVWSVAKDKTFVESNLARHQPYLQSVPRTVCRFVPNSSEEFFVTVQDNESFVVQRPAATASAASATVSSVSSAAAAANAAAANAAPMPAPHSHMAHAGSSSTSSVVAVAASAAASAAAAAAAIAASATSSNSNSNSKSNSGPAVMRPPLLTSASAIMMPRGTDSPTVSASSRHRMSSSSNSDPVQLPMASSLPIEENALSVDSVDEKPLYGRNLSLAHSSASDSVKRRSSVASQRPAPMSQSSWPEQLNYKEHHVPLLFQGSVAPLGNTITAQWRQFVPEVFERLYSRVNYNKVLYPNSDQSYAANIFSQEKIFDQMIRKDSLHQHIAESAAQSIGCDLAKLAQLLQVIRYIFEDLKAGHRLIRVLVRLNFVITIAVKHGFSKLSNTFMLLYESLVIDIHSFFAEIDFDLFVADRNSGKRMLEYPKNEYLYRIFGPAGETSVGQYLSHHGFQRSKNFTLRSSSVASSTSSENSSASAELGRTQSSSSSSDSGALKSTTDLPATASDLKTSEPRHRKSNRFRYRPSRRNSQIYAESALSTDDNADASDALEDYDDDEDEDDDVDDIDLDEIDIGSNSDQNSEVSFPLKALNQLEQVSHPDADFSFMDSDLEMEKSVGVLGPMMTEERRHRLSVVEHSQENEPVKLRRSGSSVSSFPQSVRNFTWKKSNLTKQIRTRSSSSVSTGLDKLAIQDIRKIQDASTTICTISSLIPWKLEQMIHETCEKAQKEGDLLELALMVSVFYEYFSEIKKHKKYELGSFLITEQQAQSWHGQFLDMLWSLDLQYVSALIIKNTQIQALKDLALTDTEVKKFCPHCKKLMLNEDKRFWRCTNCEMGVTCGFCNVMVKNLSIGLLDCGHIFHVSCAKEWFENEDECPSCSQNYD